MRLITYLQLAAALTIVTSCSTTEESQLIDKSDFTEKTFNAVISTSGISLLDDGSMAGIESEITFNKDTTGQWRVTKQGQLRTLNFTWHLGGDSLAIDLLAGTAGKMRVLRYGEGFALSDKRGGMLLIPNK